MTHGMQAKFLLMEHVWVELKKRLHQQYPRIGDTPEGKKAVKKRLAEVLPLVWETIPEELFEILWKSILIEWLQYWRQEEVIPSIS